MDAPTPSCGFTTSGPAGWVRLWLVNDSPALSGHDLWTVPSRFYPLRVAVYEFDSTVEHPDALVFNETTSFGGYTRSSGLDESPYGSLESNVGFVACVGGTLEVTTADLPAHEVTLVAGDFYAGNVTAVGVAPYLFLVRP